MPVIETKIVPASSRYPTRVLAKCNAGKRYTKYDHTLNADSNHRIAAFELVEQLEHAFQGWAGEWVAGKNDVTGVTYWVSVKGGYYRDDFTVQPIR